MCILCVRVCFVCACDAVVRVTWHAAMLSCIVFSCSFLSYSFSSSVSVSLDGDTKGHAPNPPNPPCPSIIRTRLLNPRYPCTPLSLSVHTYCVPCMSAFSGAIGHGGTADALRKCVCACVCICMYIYGCMYIDIDVFVCVCVCARARACAYTFAIDVCWLHHSTPRCHPWSSPFLAPPSCICPTPLSPHTIES